MILLGNTHTHPLKRGHQSAGHNSLPESWHSHHRGDSLNVSSFNTHSVILIITLLLHWASYNSSLGKVAYDGSAFTQSFIEALDTHQDVSTLHADILKSKCLSLSFCAICWYVTSDRGERERWDLYSMDEWEYAGQYIPEGPYHERWCEGWREGREGLGSCWCHPQ